MNHHNVITDGLPTDRCLARLEHSNVVRYYGAWMEFEPIQIDDGSGEVGSGTAELSNGGSSNVTPVLNWDDYTDMGEDGGMLDASSFDESAPFYGVSLFIQMQLCELSDGHRMGQDGLGIGL